MDFIDLVIWDSHPLALGATPKQVFIDGIPQLSSPYIIEKPASFQNVPKTPNFDKEAVNAIRYEGLPPLEPGSSVDDTVVFVNVKSVTVRSKEDKGLVQVFDSQSEKTSPLGIVIAKQGRVVCAGLEEACMSFVGDATAKTVDLKGGAISPGLVTFGSPLGLEVIQEEISTSDGYVYDPLSEGVPKILGGDGTLIRAVDGLQFATRDA